MSFCTNCGANVTGTFCSQCGTPASAAAPIQPAAAVPYAQPAVPGAVPAPRGTSPLVWVLVIVLGLFVLGGVAVVGVTTLVLHRVHRVATDLGVERGRDGGFSIKARGADGKDARMEFGTTGKLPSWVPVYPGSDAKGTFSVKGADGEAGNFTFTTSDDLARVRAFYADKCKDLGMKVNLESTTDGGGMFVAADEGGEQRSLSVVLGSSSGQTAVNVTYGRK